MKISKEELKKLIQEEVKQMNLNEFLWPRSKSPMRNRAASVRGERPSRGLEPEGSRWDRYANDLDRKQSETFTAAASYSDERDNEQDEKLNVISKTNQSLLAKIRNLKDAITALEKELSPEEVESEWDKL